MARIRELSTKGVKLSPGIPRSSGEAERAVGSWVPAPTTHQPGGHQASCLHSASWPQKLWRGNLEAFLPGKSEKQHVAQRLGVQDSCERERRSDGLSGWGFPGGKRLGKGLLVSQVNPGFLLKNSCFHCSTVFLSGSH